MYQESSDENLNNLKLDLICAERKFVQSEFSLHLVNLYKLPIWPSILKSEVCSEPQLWNSPTTKEYIEYWKLHVNEILEEEDYAYYEEYDEDYDFDE